MSLIRVHNLRKSYGPTQAVRDVSFDVHLGEIFGLLGPNGAGKSTTLDCVLGLRKPDAGEIWINNINAIENGSAARAELGAALQFTNLQDKMTPREAVSFFGSFYRNAQNPNELLSQFDLTEKADATFDSLSGGQRQRLVLALAFVNNPAVVFLDEPTVGLDPAARRKLHTLIRQAKSAGKAVVLTTHYMEEAEQLCDLVAIIDEGKILTTGTPTELISRTAAGGRIFLRTQSPINAEQFKSCAGVRTAQWRNESVEIEATDLHKALISVIQLIESRNEKVLELRTTSASLEDVFLQLTGKRIAVETSPF